VVCRYVLAGDIEELRYIRNKLEDLGRESVKGRHDGTDECKSHRYGTLLAL
jgi:hypothetical protein